MRDHVAAREPDLLAYCLELVGEDPFERVDESTRFAQPAIFCASIAGWRSLTAEQSVDPIAAAGHSLGEFGALVAAGAVSVERALELVVLRGQLMAQADASGSMLALLGATPAEAGAIAAQSGVVVANDNAPGQVVLSGNRQRLKQAGRIARSHRLRAIELGVAGAFHSPSMQAAVAPFREALTAVDFDTPQFPVFSCAAAAPFSDIATELADALLAPVRWRETVVAMAAFGVDTFIDVGPGTVLSRLVKRIIPAAIVAEAAQESVHV